MKSRINVILTAILFIIIFVFAFFVPKPAKVLKVEDCNIFYVDFNNNSQIDKNEKIILKDVEPSDFCKRNKALCVHNTEKLFLHKSVLVKPFLSVEGKDAQCLLLKHNLIKPNKNLRNELLLKYYSILTFRVKKFKIKYTHKNYQKKKIKKKLFFKENFSIDNLKFYFTDMINAQSPTNTCKSGACKELNRLILNSKSIDFAIFGIENQPILLHSLREAKKSGAKIRCVIDENADGSNIYADSHILSEEFQCISDKNHKKADRYMHNKFFIFNGNIVYTGSANISATDLSNFNANNIVIIRSKKVANLYKTEFEKMYSGNFHNEKSKTYGNDNLDKNIVGIYFSPQDNVISNEIIPLINEAKKYIFVPAFVITQNDFINALIKAKQRGVEVKVLTDATSAMNKYSKVSFLRRNGVWVKVENMAGKMHSKTIIIDDKYVVIGSMNFSKSGEFVNDENSIIFNNSKIARMFKLNFLYNWYEIPEKWGHLNPRAESPDSINSCSDGVDNNFNGFVDAKEPFCQ